VAPVAPADTRGNIEVLVSRIRRALGDPALIRTGPGGYSLTAGPGCWMDTEAFLAAAGDGRELLADRPADALACFRDALKLWQARRWPRTPTRNGRNGTAVACPWRC